MTGKSPFEIVHGLSPYQPIDLISLPTDYCMPDYAQAFAEHIHNLHAKIRWIFFLSNDIYELAANAHRRHREFNEGDHIMVHIYPERYPKNVF